MVFGVLPCTVTIMLGCGSELEDNVTIVLLECVRRALSFQLSLSALLMPPDDLESWIPLLKHLLLILLAVG